MKAPNGVAASKGYAFVVSIHGGVEAPNAFISRRTRTKQKLFSMCWKRLVITNESSLCGRFWMQNNQLIRGTAHGRIKTFVICPAWVFVINVQQDHDG